jgi:hypothetical protein
MIRAILLFSFSIIIFSCSKDSVEPNIDYSGSYRGTVIDSVNGEFFTTFDYNSVTLTRNSGSNNYTITNGLIRTSTARIVGSSFTIPQVDAGKYLTYNIIESADGNFNGTGIIRLHVSFYQNWVDPVTNVITKRFVRKCVLTKQ